MFALIKTNGASEIAIHIPGDDNCSASLKRKYRSDAGEQCDVLPE